MKNRRQSHNSGFTMVEVLAAAAALIILLGLSTVAVITYIHKLQITKLDNAAREIYMAAQNNAVLLSNEGRLEGLVVKKGEDGKSANEIIISSAIVTPGSGDAEGGDVNAYYVYSRGEENVVKSLIPDGSIEPSLWDGYFYVVYAPDSGSVTDVFYAEKELTEAKDFKTFYGNWAYASKEQRMKNSPMIGHYAGGVADGERIAALLTPILEIENGEKLIVRVSYRVPAALSGKVKLSVNVKYYGEKSPLDTTQFGDIHQQDNSGNFVYSYEWILDSLDKEQFKNLFENAKLGGDFTVSAEVTYTDNSTSTFSREAASNSLFAYFDEETDDGNRSSDSDTAYIGCLRHLQNLNSEFSNMSGKEKAVQIADIDCNNETYEGYNFKPIKGKDNTLKSYTGGDKGHEFVIRNLKIWDRKEAYNTGLFEEASGMTITNVRLVNVSVSGGENDTHGNVGALAGEAKGSTFDNCWVYWEKDPGSTNKLSDILVENDKLQYQIQGKNAGGLVGFSQDNNTFTNCFAATLVKGTVSAGGLIGRVLTTNETITIENSYTDCYLLSTGGQAAGLIGNIEGSSAKLSLKDCYTAGFIAMGDKETKTAAGLFLGNGTVTSESKNVYSVIRYQNYSQDDNEKTVHYLYDGVGSNTNLSNFYYLASTTKDKDNKDIPQAKTYDDMTKDGFLDAMGTAFAKKSAVESHPYNLEKDMELTAYRFPSLKDLPHYGDWGEQFNKSALVYYEKYQDGSGFVYGFSGGGENHLKVDSLNNELPIVEDGYAVAILAEDLQGITNENKKDFIYVKYPSDSESVIKIDLPEETTEIDGEKYYLIFLKEITNSKTAAPFFYQPITYSFTFGSEETKGEYYFCPHFAKTALEKGAMPVDASGEVDLKTAAKALEGEKGIAVRTPRHLYSLSEHNEYYHKEVFPGYNYEQELPLDYSTYTAYDAKSWTQYPIGTNSVPFNGVYNGMCNVIKNVPLKVDSGMVDIGLFGYAQGTLQNIVLKMDKAFEVAKKGSDSIYVGALAGGNALTINNCAVYGVNIKGTVSVTGGKAYFGGLVGRNSGVIQNCAAENAELVSDNSGFVRSYVGGFVGQNELSGIISGCYAVGRLSASVTDTAQANICGFAGYNQGSIERSYAAVDLKSSGAEVTASGFCGETKGSQKDTFYLNQGNFTYRGESYNASYEQKTAKPATYAQFTESDDKVEEKVTIDGMMRVEPKTDQTFPYFTAVRDADLNPVHYGQWPERISLGVMGVYYWEELTIGEKTSYNLSLLAVDPNDNTITKQTTLSTSHSDGGVVREFGYGYYYEDGSEATLEAENINYMGVAGEAVDSAKTVEDVDEAFKELMPNFIFRSYKSYSGNDNTGLYPTALNGTFTLSETYKEKEVKVTFTVNPHFADALAVATPNGWTLENKATTAVPGTENNPYEVRAVQQLQNINWNSTNKNTNTVIVGNTNNTEFPYLSCSGMTEKYYWSQTHDLKGGAGAEITPIAEYYDTTNTDVSIGYLHGWFGGVYDGDGYVIENVNIQGQTSSCAGLFGMVYNGVLKDIILYSSDGNGTVKSAHDRNSFSRWYAIGALAGFAASDSNSAVQNCAVAGYTINANTFTASGGWGGSGIGGLIGISNMDLTGCTAVTKIVIDNANDNDNMRVGGLVGTCQKSISNCYAGGEISIPTPGNVNVAKGMYIGGIVGGSYFKPLAVAGNNGELIGVQGHGGDSNIDETNNKLENCYSYVTLPSADTKLSNGKSLGALYALGGTGEIVAAGSTGAGAAANHGICTMKNCYYLDSVKPAVPDKSDIKTDIKRPLTEIMALTYEQLAAKDMCAKLNNGSTGPFAPVTTFTPDGTPVHGKYSFPPSSRGDLAGMDYPFPTILTREDVYHVHYGQWPLNGIKRGNGAAPIELDIFTANEETEELGLADGIAEGGTWAVTVGEGGENEIATAEIDGGSLTVTAKKKGTTRLNVTYTVEGKEYTLPITVNVTAVLELHTGENPMVLYTNDTTELVLKPYGKDNKEFILTDKGITLELKSVVVDGKYIASYEIKEGPDDNNGSVILSLGTGNVPITTAVNISFSYSHGEGDDKVTYENETSTVSLQISAPPVKFEPETVSVQVGGKVNVTPNLIEGSGATMEIKSVASNNNTVATVTTYEENGAYTVTGVTQGKTELVFLVDITRNDRVHHVRLILDVTVTAPTVTPENPEAESQDVENQAYTQ